MNREKIIECLIQESGSLESNIQESYIELNIQESSIVIKIMITPEREVRVSFHIRSETHFPLTADVSYIPAAWKCRSYFLRPLG